jgi:uncharacterized glyoxalase superfamily protein PhnB
MLENMLTHFPKAVPEIPVSNVEKAAEYYVNVLGFHSDWGNDQGGIGGISQGECRMFLTNAPFRQHYGTDGIVMVWLNLDSKREVDELYHRWREAGARIVAEPEDKPWRLREFRVADPDGNQLRVFYDFSWELRQEQA